MRERRQQLQYPRRDCEGPLQRDEPQGPVAPAPELAARAGTGAGAGAPQPQPPARPGALCAAADPRRRRSLLLLLGAAVLASVPLGALSLGLGALGGKQQQHLGGEHSVQLPPPLPLARASPMVGRVGAAAVGAGEVEGHAGEGRREEAGGGGSGSWRRRAGSRQLIENGDMAQVASYPYVTVVARSDGSYLCAGTLIHPRVVVTAAHCVTPDVGGTSNPRIALGMERLAPASGPGAAAAAAAAGGGRLATLAALVGLGSTGGRVGGDLVASASRVHPDYKPGSFDYDVAVLLLDSPAPPSATPAKLPEPNQALPPSPLLRVLGWGATEANALSDALRKTDVAPLDSKERCAEMFKPFGTEVTQRMMCVTGRTCAGDSGGPVVWLPQGNAGGPDTHVLVGQVSFGFPRGRGQGCPSPNPATVLADLRAPRLNAWLRAVVAGAGQGGAGGDGRAALQGLEEDYERPSN